QASCRRRSQRRSSIRRTSASRWPISSTESAGCATRRTQSWGESLPFGAMAEETIRLGGMALPNGVLVHGPHAWACAIRDEDGEIEVVSARKRIRASRIKSPLLRGPARLFEALALLPQIKAKLPAAKLPME